MINNLLTQAASAAVACELHTGVPAELLIAQWAIESGWGLHTPGNNAFGIKSRPGETDRQLLRTKEWFTDAELANFLAGDAARTAEPTGQANAKRKEYTVRDWFATFPTLTACFDRRAQLFRAGTYKPFAEQYDRDGDLEKLVKGIAPIYATSPDYSASILKVIGQRDTKYALAAARPPDEPVSA